MYVFGRLLGLATSLLDRLLPKSANSYVIQTPSHLDDQARETIRALHKRGCDKITWLVTSRPKGIVGFEGASIVKKQSLAGLSAYLRSGVVFHTHGLGNLGLAPSRRKRFVNLWHGMPLKRIPEVRWSSRLSDIVLSTGACHNQNLATAFGVPIEQVCVTGLPRNDALIRAASDHASSRVDDDFVVAWLPTFRSDTRGHTDGYDAGNPFQLSGATFEAMEDLAVEHNIRIVLKHHRNVANDHTYSGTRVEVWTDETLHEKGLTLYEFLGRSDLLVTDYSSAWIDYLLIDRPIIFVTEDETEYSKSRGFYPLARSALRPGETVESMAELSVALGSTDLHLEWAAKRRMARDLHHAFQDGASADRVAGLGARLNSGLHRR